MSKELITISLTLPGDMLTSVYALLGGTAPVTLNTPVDKAPPPPPPPEPVAASTTVVPTEASTLSTGADASPSSGATDAAGTVFDPARHTGTKVQSGLWRMKVGVKRGPGEETILAGAGSPPPPPPAEDDEFADFVANGAPTARVLTEADLSAACKEAAQKVGSPVKVKEIIAKYTPAGEIAHSRMVPADQREAFLAEIEAAHGFTYAAGL